MLQRLEPPDRVILGYLAVITGLVLVFYRQLVVAPVLLLDHALVVAAIFGLAAVQQRHPTRFWRILRDWYPLLVVPLAFRELHYLVHPINPRDADAALRAWDRALFGVDPTVALQAWMSRPLTEVLQIVYSTYYFMPIGLAVLLYATGRRDAYRATLTGLLLAFFLSYLGYFLVPALGPRHTMVGEHAEPLSGYACYRLLSEGLDKLELEMRDCFPSGHTEIALVVLLYAWRFERRYFWGLLPAVGLLLFSTVYLRYHYVVDVLAGALLAAAIPALAGLLFPVPVARSEPRAAAAPPAPAYGAPEKLLT
ncbi:MAG: phosphatase PAP2 family protein [Planctomycetes bacterium]|nr:phosphatase PAP2 family protein [Planctomycetota bacterium]